MLSIRIHFAAAALCCLVSLQASADPIVPEPIFPKESYPDLHQEMARHDRAYYRFLALPQGWSLEANLTSPDNLALINQFLDQSESEDVKAVTGKHPYEMFSNYEEYGDLGMFGGVAVAATAFKYMTLKRENAPADELAEARRDLVRAIETQHVFWQITGTPGVVARGVQRLVDEDPEAPPIPRLNRNIVDLADGDGNPLPAPKNNGTWRADNSKGTLPPDTWIWEDSCSKDQMIGQIFAMVLLYDAAVGDPDIDQALVTRMQQDALATAAMLMETRDISTMEGPIGFGMYDLIIMDADGRPTMFHDFNPYSMEKIYVEAGSPGYNLFNLIMALGVMKGLYHVTGSTEIETYIYQELMGNRNYLEMTTPPLENEEILDYILVELKTNFSNVNMIATAIWLALYTESDPVVNGFLQKFMTERWWDKPGRTRTAKLSKQPFYNMVWMGLTDAGVDRAMADQTAALLTAYKLGPYMNDAVINCDEAEIEAKQCLAVDGTTTLILEGGTNRTDSPVATEALDPSIRPPSNFDARSDPFEANGGGGPRMNPGGDLLAAYWMGRFLDLNPAGVSSKSPYVRTHIPVPGYEQVADPSPEASEEVASDVIEPEDQGPQAEVPGVDTGVGVDSVVNDEGHQPADASIEQDTGSGKASGGCSAGDSPLAGPLVILSFLLVAFVALRMRFEA
ncbi:MAG TPA: hypothetical protein PLB35_04155 [Myxococcota bacterium]|nr:hypothetical protein [Myxococcota bacterium]HOH76425.1 hypothetical protein [Myxococcota bacterium]